MNAGRNDPCPCQSGKKYKKCCLVIEQAHKVQDISYRRFRDTEGKLVGRIFRHALEVFGPTSVPEAWDEFHCWEHGGEYDPESLINQAFVPFLLFSWELDPADTQCDLALEAKTVTESFIETNRLRLSKDEIEVLEKSNRPVFAFYEITDVSPGYGFSLRNVLTELEYEVTESSGSKGPQRGNIIFGAICLVHGKYQIIAMSPYMLPPLAVGLLVDVRNDLLKRLKTQKLNDLQIQEYAIEMRDVYFELLNPVLNPEMPQITNSDGGPLVPQILHFEITDPHEAFLALSDLALSGMSEEKLRADAKFKDGRIHEAQIPWFKKGKGKSPFGPNTVLGTVRISDKKLTVEVNSDKRANAIKKKVTLALGPGVKFIAKDIESIEGNIGREPSQSRRESSAIPLDQLPPEVLEAVKEMANAHWAKWFDEKIPALRGMNPKQAAKTKEGRELLEALLNSYEHRSANANNPTTNLFQPDLEQLRSKLGLT